MSGNQGTFISRPDQLPGVFAQPFSYWNECRGDRWAPTWSAFHLEKLDARLLPWSVVVDVLADDFRYRFWGSERARLIGAELSNRLASQIPDGPMRNSNLNEYRDLVGARAPMVFNTLITLSGGAIVRFHSLRLPISDDGEQVTKIYSALDYEQFNDFHFGVLSALLRQEMMPGHTVVL